MPRRQDDKKKRERNVDKRASYAASSDGAGSGDRAGDAGRANPGSCSTVIIRAHAADKAESIGGELATSSRYLLRCWP